MLFRQIHFIVDTVQRQIHRPSLWAYLNYQLNLFALLSGPIQRFQQFEAQWRECTPVQPDPQSLTRAYARTLLGTIQLLIIGDACLDLYEAAVASTTWADLPRGAAIFYSYPAYVYFNFAGYCNIVIGAASLFGLELPENFDRPYKARNMLDYWNRWHITLSHWIRDYVFMPLYKMLAKRWPSRSAYFAVPCFFVAFLIAGLWHGSSSNFAIFGLLNGIGVSVAKAWENRLVATRGRSGLRTYMESKNILWAATIANFHFACSTFLFFPQDLRGWNALLAMAVSPIPA